jgi:hypothetical protein
MATIELTILLVDRLLVMCVIDPDTTNKSNLSALVPIHAAILTTNFEQFDIKNQCRIRWNNSPSTRRTIT